MNRKQRKMAVALARKGVSKGAYRWQDYISPLCDKLYQIPLNDAESKLSKEIVDWWQERGATWYHGGVSGLEQGAMLLPASLTGADPRDEGAAFLWRKDFVYITQDESLAQQYAKRARGAVYQVRPLGDLQVDPTALRRFRISADVHKTKIKDVFRLIKEFACPRAEIISLAN